jgi:hypothetical protein
MPHPSHSSRFYYPHNSGRGVQIIKLLIISPLLIRIKLWRLPSFFLLFFKFIFYSRLACRIKNVPWNSGVNSEWILYRWLSHSGKNSQKSGVG